MTTNANDYDNASLITWGSDGYSGNVLTIRNTASTNNIKWTSLGYGALTGSISTIPNNGYITTASAGTYGFGSYNEENEKARDILKNIGIEEEDYFGCSARMILKLLKNKEKMKYALKALKMQGIW